MAENTTAPAAPVSDTQGTPTETTPETLMHLFAAQKGDEDDTPDDVPAEETSETPAEGSEDTPAADAETSEETPSEAESETPTLYTVMVNGESQQVPLDELLAGYSRTGDYTRKTQAVAEERRRIESESSAMRADRERYTQGLKEVEALLTASADEPDWTKLADELEPAEYNRARAQWDTRVKRVSALRTQREDLERAAAADRRAQTEETTRAEHQKLFAAIPEWKDKAKAEAEQREIVDYALKAGEPFGVTEAGLSDITTAFPILVLRKAMLFDRMMAAKPKVVGQKVPTPTAKPGAKIVQTKISPKQAAFDRLATSGDLKAAEDYFLARLTEASR